MPKGKYARKPRVMESTMSAPPESPAAAPPSDEPPFEATVLTLLQQMTAKLQTLDERVNAVETNAPRSQFVPATPETYSADYDRYKIAEMAPADSQPRSMTVPITSDGIEIPRAFLGDFPAKFGSEMWVRLNLDAVPHGRADGKTRGQLMEEAGTPNAPGKVIDRTFLSKVINDRGRRGVWKYRVQFPREVMPGAVYGTVSLHETELIPA